MKLLGAVPCGGFSTMPVISKVGPKSLPTRDDAILMRLLRRHFLDRDDIAAMLLIGRDRIARGSARFCRPRAA